MISPNATTFQGQSYVPKVPIQMHLGPSSFLYEWDVSVHQRNNNNLLSAKDTAVGYDDRTFIH